MVFSRVSLAFICLLSFALVHFCQGQNSPNDYLAAHNPARKDVGVPPMSWNSTLASYAYKHVKSHKADCKLIHSSGPYGENLAKGSGSSFTGKYAVNLWVNEKRYYNYKSNKCIGGECLHYKQVVWKKSVQVGCARIQCDNGWWYVSCNYYPRGNINGQWPY